MTSVHQRRRSSGIMAGLAETKRQHQSTGGFRLSFSRPSRKSLFDTVEGGQSSSEMMSLGSLFDSVGDLEDLEDDNHDSQSDADSVSETTNDAQLNITSPTTPRTTPTTTCTGYNNIKKMSNISLHTGFICPQCRESLPSMDALLDHHKICLEQNTHCTPVRKTKRSSLAVNTAKKPPLEDVNTGIANMIAASAGHTPNTPPRASMFRRRMSFVDTSQAAPRVETRAEATARKIAKRFRERYIMPFVRTFGGPIDETYLRVGEFIETCANSMLKAYKQQVSRSPFRKGNMGSDEDILLALCEEVESDVMGELYESIWVSLYSKSVNRDAAIAIRIKLIQDSGVDLSEMAGVPAKFRTPLVKGHSGEVPYQAAIHAIAKLTSYGNLFPTEQRKLFVAMIKMIFNEASARAAASGTGSSGLAADDFLPLLIYVILSCRDIGHPVAVLNAMRCLSSQQSSETEYYLTSFEFALQFIARAELPAEVMTPHVAHLVKQTRQEHKQAIARCNSLKNGHAADDTSSFDKNSKYYVKPAMAMRRPRCSFEDDLGEAGWVQTVKFCEIQIAFLFSQIKQMDAAQTNLYQLPGCLAEGKEASPLAGRCDVSVDTAIRMRLARMSCVMALPVVSVVAVHPATGVSVPVEGEVQSDEKGAVMVFQPKDRLPPRHMVRVIARWSWTSAGGLDESVFTFRTGNDPESI